MGVDLNPIASLITRVKTSPVPAGIEDTLAETVDQASNMSSVSIPDIPNLDHWFEKPIQSALAAFVAAIGSARGEHQEILRLALSSIIVRMSKQDSDTRYAAVSKNTKREDVFSAFNVAARKITSVLSNRKYELTPATVITGDSLDLSPNNICHPVGLTITSPPYPNAYEYWLYHKYRMWWLGYDPLAVKQREIGARAHFFRKNPHTPGHFRKQMQKVLELLHSVMIPDGFACFLVGRSKIHGRTVDNASIIQSAALASGFTPVFKCERYISPRRKSFNPSYANIKTETLLVFRHNRGAP